ncbi:MAG: NADH-quinone oxidoreductase subunit L, partial [Rhodospirillaceae bacterium]|nr:NADH-quinone oxidoreductase subunit L [Rhodospirillaceae bacterium]MBT5751310.1 NADH-quinone oxidoreductase subunit L [Rhodospirillaceae bacterium]
MLYVAAIFLPLLGAVVTGFFGRWLGDRQSELIACAMLILSALISVFLFFEIAGSGQNIVVELFAWIDSGNLQANWALKFDTLTVVMMVVVTVVSAMVHVYSIG